MILVMAGLKFKKVISRNLVQLLTIFQDTLIAKAIDCFLKKIAMLVSFSLFTKTNMVLIPPLYLNIMMVIFQKTMILFLFTISA